MVLPDGPGACGLLSNRVVKRPLPISGGAVCTGGRYRDRTSDLFGVKQCTDRVYERISAAQRALVVREQPSAAAHARPGCHSVGHSLRQGAAAVPHRQVRPAGRSSLFEHVQSSSTRIRHTRTLSAPSPLLLHLEACRDAASEAEPRAVCGHEAATRQPHRAPRSIDTEPLDLGSEASGFLHVRHGETRRASSRTCRRNRAFADRGSQVVPRRARSGATSSYRCRSHGDARRSPPRFSHVPRATEAITRFLFTHDDRVRTHSSRAIIARATGPQRSA
jgi:hypothetical protein